MNEAARRREGDVRLCLYSHWRSSSAGRVRIGLGLKGLAHEYRAVDLSAGEQDRPEQSIVGEQSAPTATASS